MARLESLLQREAAGSPDRFAAANGPAFPPNEYLQPDLLKASMN